VPVKTWAMLEPVRASPWRSRPSQPARPAGEAGSGAGAGAGVGAGAATVTGATTGADGGASAAGTLGADGACGGAAAGVDAGAAGGAGTPGGVCSIAGGATLPRLSRRSTPEGVGAAAGFFLKKLNMKRNRSLKSNRLRPCRRGCDSLYNGRLLAL
jgi:hypothetical protein